VKAGMRDRTLLAALVVALARTRAGTATPPPAETV
jgi:hypothetical protein